MSQSLRAWSSAAAAALERLVGLLRSLAGDGMGVSSKVFLMGEMLLLKSLVGERRGF